MEFLKSDSLSILRNINLKLERNFHEHTHILYDIRTLFGSKEINYLEIGSYVGSSACLIMSHPFATNVFCVDPCILEPNHYSGKMKQYETLLNNVSNNNNGNNFKIIQDYSCNKSTLDIVKDIKIDILFIDGDHRYQGVIDDFNNYVNLVSEDGYIIFDDYLDFEYSPEVKTAVDKIVNDLDPCKFQILGTPKNKYNALPISPDRFKNLNEFVIRKTDITDNKLFAIVIPTYKRKNGETPNHMKNVADFISKQTYQNYHIFLIGDNYEDEEEFKQLISLFPSDKIYSYNNKSSYREDYFESNNNKWAIGGVMALKHGVSKAKELNYKYYVHLDDDDTWTLDKLENHKKVIDQFPKSDFIFHGSKYGNMILPIEHKEYNLDYNNLKPRSCNIVHSSNCLSLNDNCFNLFINYTNNIMDIAEKIKNKEIKEYDFFPFDAGLIDLLVSKHLNFIYISKILSDKPTDGNHP